MRSCFRDQVAALSLASLSVGVGAAAEAGEAKNGDVEVSTIWERERSEPQAALLEMPSLPAIPLTQVPNETASPIPPVPAPALGAQPTDETEELVDLSAKGINSSVKKTIKDNLVGALFGAALLAYGGLQGIFRIFPNKIHLDTFALAKVSGSQDDDPRATRFQALSMKVDSRSALVQAGLPAKFHWVLAMIKARFHEYWPTMCFSSSPLLRSILRAGPHEIVTRPIRSWASSSFAGRISDGATLAADERYRGLTTKDPKATHQPLTYDFLVCTYERVFDVQPRACRIPQQDVISYLLHIPELYQAAQNTGRESMSWLVRVLEICGAIALRYPKALENEGLGEHLPKAREVANEIFRMYALEPEESEQFLARYVTGDTSHITPEPAEVQRMRKLWYGTSNPELQREREEAERTMSSFGDYDRLCRQYEIPAWLFRIALPEAVGQRGRS